MPPAMAPRRIAEVEVASGDTLLAMLDRVGIGRAEAHAVVEGLSGVYDPRRLRAGQRLQIETDAAARSLVRLELDLSRRERVELVRAGDGAFRAARTTKALVRERRMVQAEVTTTVHAAGVEGGVPPSVMVDVVKLFSWDVDFQRETRPGDEVAVLFDVDRLVDGTVVGGGAIHYARLETGGRTLEGFRFERDGDVEYFDRDGVSLRKLLLRTPISDARVSSSFGMRRHPILGYTRMHRGVDFAAPTGTPIYAAGTGRVARAGRLGGYGNYVRLEHGNGYATAYAHLSRFADGLRAGQRVRQGEIIGYVGSTGRSTGPHLHFEVLEHGRQVNPLTVAQPPARRLEDAARRAFTSHVVALEEAIRAASDTAIAAGDGPAARRGRDG